jgi:hypothetical protein
MAGPNMPTCIWHTLSEPAFRACDYAIDGCSACNANHTPDQDARNPCDGSAYRSRKLQSHQDWRSYACTTPISRKASHSHTGFVNYYLSGDGCGSVTPAPPMPAQCLPVYMPACMPACLCVPGGLVCYRGGYGWGWGFLFLNGEAKLSYRFSRAHYTDNSILPY